MEREYEQLTQTKRCEIYRLHVDGKSQSQIAEAIGVNRSTICRELKRNHNRAFGYLPDSAHAMCHERRNRPGAKISRSAALQSLLADHIAMGWSPEVIAGRMALEASKHVISHESIYKWIYDEGKQLKLHHYLIRRKRKRGSRPCKKAKLSKIPNRISIHDRPKEHDTTFGHWEGDTIIFAQGKGAIVTLYERQSKLTLAEKVSQKTASLVTQVLEAMLSNLPEEARKSITFDNGGEFTDHEKLIHLLEDKTYFCDSYASWQKGGVENANGIIRRDIPKGSLQQNYTERDIHMIIEDINNMPRKSIGFLTPVEKFNALCKNQHSLHYPLINNLVALRV